MTWRESREEKEGSSTMLSMGGERNETWAEVAAVEARTGNCKSVKSLRSQTRKATKGNAGKLSIAATTKKYSQLCSTQSVFQ